MDDIKAELNKICNKNKGETSIDNVVGIYNNIIKVFFVKSFPEKEKRTTVRCSVKWFSSEGKQPIIRCSRQ